MLKYWILTILVVFMSFPSLAAEKEVRMQVLGAVCPSCAYGLEKKFMKIEGVSAFDVDFTNGIVSVCVDTGVQIKDEDLTTIFEEAGYAYRGQEEVAECSIPEKPTENTE